MREKYESLALVQLKELAKVRGLKGTSTMKKADLVEAMLAEEERLKKEEEAKAAEEKQEAAKSEEAEKPERTERPVRQVPAEFQRGIHVHIHQLRKRSTLPRAVRQADRVGRSGIA